MPLHLHLGSVTFASIAIRRAAFVFEGCKQRARVSIWRLFDAFFGPLRRLRLSLALWLRWSFPIAVMLGPINLSVLFAASLTGLVKISGLVLSARRKT